MIERRAFARQAVALLGALGATPGFSGRARAQDAAAAYPDHAVNVVCPWAAGGSTDAFARVLCARLSTDLGKPFVVDNRTGASGTIGMLAFTSETMKHSAANAIASGEFVYNLCGRPLFDAMNTSSGDFPEGVNEFEAAGLEMAPCRVVRAPRVAAAPAALECRVAQTMQLQDSSGGKLPGWIIIGEVVGVHIAEAFLRDGRFHTAAAEPLPRCGHRDYAELGTLSQALRPTDGGSYAAGQPDR